jgi:DNA-binding transcriptional LysR family regulator
VTPTKWVRIWNERLPRTPLDLIPVTAAEAAGLVRNHDADAALLRLPIDPTGLHAIPLYSETTVVVVPKDHVVTAVEEVAAEDLADEFMLHPLDNTLDWAGPPGRQLEDRPATTAEAVELVAAGVGLLVVPQSLARLHHRRDLTYRPLVDAPESRVALSWPEDGTTDLMEQFIGIVRGRTVNSTRGPAPAKSPANSPANSPAKSPAKNQQRGARAPQSGKGRKPRRRS